MPFAKIRCELRSANGLEHFIDGRTEALAFAPASGLDCLVEDGSCFFLHRATIALRPHSQAALGFLVEVADGDAGHDCNVANAIIAVNAITFSI